MHPQPPVAAAGRAPVKRRTSPAVRNTTVRPVLDGRLQSPAGQPVRGIQEVHQPFAFTALPGKIWQGRQSPLSA